MKCRCCGLPIVIEYQLRRVKPPLVLLTCRTIGCKLEHVTLTLEALEDYQTRDLTVWGVPNDSQ